MTEIRHCCRPDEVVFVTDAPTLAGADLRGTALGGGDFRGVDLRAADLRSADLRLAAMAGADLRGANLLGALLNDADLGGALVDESTEMDPEWRLAWELATFGGRNRDLSGV